MGTKLFTYYERAKEMGGLNAQIKLAMITKLSGEKAKEAVDTPELIQLFEKAFAQLKSA